MSHSAEGADCRLWAPGAGMDPGMSENVKPLLTLHDRLEAVLAHHGWSARHWSVAAGCREESHVSQLMRTLRREDKPFTGELATWVKLANAAQVSLDWLCFGRNEPEWANAPTKPDPYPSRASVLSVAPTLGFSQAAIADVAGLTLDHDPGFEYWLHELLNREHLRRQQTQQRRRRKRIGQRGSSSKPQRPDEGSAEAEPALDD
ncbi:MAG TPA: hypothetical protein VFQ61_06595 [Polyangiaceae bacterium]|nr:hypothetical protein [Polyangiaceae bacterium]